MTTPTPIPLRLSIGVPVRSKVTHRWGYIAETPYVDHQGITWVPIRWTGPDGYGFGADKVQDYPACNLAADLFHGVGGAL